MSSLRVLLLDIETAPNVAYVWGLWDQNISTNQLVSNSHILCWSAKWLGEREVMHSSLFRTNQKDMLEQIHALMSEADAVVHYNGNKFDIPTLNREFLTTGMEPPSPSKQIDLLRIVRRQFKFSSNKLDFVCQTLGLGNKVEHKGMDLWRDCLANVPAAWKIMERYNSRDVVLLEKLYHKVLPWIPGHPNNNLYSPVKEGCPRCGSVKYQKRGVAHTATMSYIRYQCQSCHGWFKGAKAPTHAPLAFAPIT